MRWEDVATVSAVVRTKSFLAAAKELGLRHSSISRRIAAIEEELGEPLFLRGRRLTSTALANEIEEHAKTMSVAARHLDGALAARRANRGAKIVITTSDALLPLLMRALDRLDKRPRVRLVVTDEERELEPGAIDIALRPTGTPRRSLRGRKLGTLRVGVYRRKGTERGGATSTWILPSDDMRTRASMRWLKRVPEQEQGAEDVMCDTLLALRDACVAGLGRAILPSFLAIDDARLEHVSSVDEGTPMWLFVATTRGPQMTSSFVDDLARALKAEKGAWR